MPIFEYVCKDCGTEFDDLVSISNRDNPQQCPSCGSTNSERKISVFCASSGEGGGGGTVCPSTGGT